MGFSCIEKEIVLKAPVSRVWKALTDMEEFGAWFMVNLKSGFIVGQHAVGNITYPGYEYVMFDVEVVGMDPESAFSWRWHPYAIEPDVDYSAEPTTLVEFRLKAIPEGTRLSVRESGFEQLSPERRSEALESNEEGWAAQMQNVRDYLEG